MEVPDEALQSLKGLFALVSPEGRERVGAPEVARLLAILCLPHSPADVRRVLNARSASDRRVTFPDFAKAILGVSQESLASRRDLQRAFAYLAGDGLPAGYISASALHSALRITRQAASADGLDASEAAALAALPLRLQGGATALPSSVLGALPGDAGGLICISDLLSLVLS